MADTASRRQKALIAVGFCLAAVLLASLPALGLRLTPGPGHDRHFTSTLGQPDQVFLTRVKISGSVVQPLSPGVSAPIMLSFRNGSSANVKMSRVRVRIRSVVAPHATALRPCSRLDFKIRQMDKRRLRIPEGHSNFTRIRLKQWRWPMLTMVNRPVNQDGCKGAQLVLRFRAHQVRVP